MKRRGNFDFIPDVPDSALGISPVIKPAPERVSLNETTARMQKQIQELKKQRGEVKSFHELNPHLPITYGMEVQVGERKLTPSKEKVDAIPYKRTAAATQAAGPRVYERGVNRPVKTISQIRGVAPVLDHSEKIKAAMDQVDRSIAENNARFAERMKELANNERTDYMKAILESHARFKQDRAKSTTLPEEKAVRGLVSGIKSATNLASKYPKATKAGLIAGGIAVGSAIAGGLAYGGYKLYKKLKGGKKRKREETQDLPQEDEEEAEE